MAELPHLFGGKSISAVHWDNKKIFEKCASVYSRLRQPMRAIFVFFFSFFC